MTPRHLLLLLAALLAATAARADYQPKAEQVADNVYAIVGPLGQRSAENDGLNANYGFVVTPAGVVLIDSGASRRGAQKLAAAIRVVTDQPVRWVINTGSQDHRWLGNAWFAEKGAAIVALERTAARLSCCAIPTRTIRATRWCIVGVQPPHLVGEAV